ncbi:hypothetical protein B0T10DRAFT_556918 [Thelonectria olida]|uniref:Uncharacterized protein n=1 Tax=Thelonectria olida TaxID=1576542 RepID=A0A9P8WDN3_9HYPO|nr:hypothetical protein B0T10DRAFT_556918 [Thelonectria olida]
MSQSTLGSDAYMATNASDKTLVDSSNPSHLGKVSTPSPKLSLKEKIKRKLDGSVDPTQAHAREPTKNWEARAMALM